MIKREINLGVLTQQWQRNAEVTVSNWKNKKYIFVTIIGVFLHGLSQMDLSQIHPLKRYVIVSLFICSIISTLCCAGSESAIIIRNTKYLRQGCETRPNARLYQLLSIQLCATFENVPTNDKRHSFTRTKYRPRNRSRSHLHFQYRHVDFALWEHVWLPTNHTNTYVGNVGIYLHTLHYVHLFVLSK